MYMCCFRASKFAPEGQFRPQLASFLLDLLSTRNTQIGSGCVAVLSKVSSSTSGGSFLSLLVFGQCKIGLDLGLQALGEVETSGFRQGHLQTISLLQASGPYYCGK